MRTLQPAVCILASKRNGTLYVGVTSDLIQRVWQPKNGFVEGFTRRYRVRLLMYFELHDSMEGPSSARSGSRNGGGRGRRS